MDGFGVPLGDGKQAPLPHSSEEDMLALLNDADSKPQAQVAILQLANIPHVCDPFAPPSQSGVASPSLGEGPGPLDPQMLESEFRPNKGASNLPQPPEHWLHVLVAQLAFGIRNFTNALGYAQA